MSENNETRYEKIISSIVGVTAYQIEGVASLSSDTDNKLTGRVFRSTCLAEIKSISTFL